MIKTKSSKHLWLVMGLASLISLMTLPVFAFPISHISLAQRVVRADQIVIARVVECQRVREIENNDLRLPPLQAKFPLPTMQAKFIVEQVVKGAALDPGSELYFKWYAPAAANEQRVMLFLDASGNLMQVYSSPGPLILVGDETEFDSSAEDNLLFRRILKYLAEGLANAGKDARLNMLKNLRDDATFFCVICAGYGNADTLRPALKEEGLGLERFLETEILPLIRKLAAEPGLDPRVRDEAILTAGLLNDPTVIPGVAALIRGKNHGWINPMVVLDGYRTSKAVKPLIALLSDEHEEVRYRSTYSLVAIGDRAAIPHLLKLLDDPSPKVRRIAVSGLYAITKEEPYPQSDSRTNNYETEEHLYLAAWKKWAAEQKKDH